MWKIERDPFYSFLYRLAGNREVLKEAGFFEDTSDKHEPITDPNYICTALDKISNCHTNNPAILMTTGSFAPFHRGHLEMMETAKQCAEQYGFNVIGGYISPAHDEYVSVKCGSGELDVCTRIAIIEAAIKESDWLMVDRWGSLVTKRDVNFTDCITHLERYLERHIGYKPTVIYVCGGDLANFSLTFAGMGHCIVVSRPGNDKTEHYKRHPLNQHDRIMWTEGHSAAASSKIRAGDESDIPERSIEILHSIKQSLPGKIIMRDEQCFSVQDWDIGISLWNSFRDRLVSIIEKQFACCDVEVSDIFDQYATAEAVLLNSKNPVISLDPLIETDCNLQLSRLFHVSSPNRIGFIARPGSMPLEQQINDIPSGTYTLFDDDIASGATIRYVVNLLSERIKINRVQSLAIAKDGVIDIGDCRDFLIGSHDGGLVVKLPNGEIARAPYFFPYVDPSRGLSIPYNRAKQFSIDCWNLNREFFARTDLTVGDMSMSSRVLLHYVGFDDNVLMSDVCAWHLTYL